MGTFNWPMRISSPDGRLSREIEAAVDTGAMYTTIPTRLLRDLGTTRAGKRRVLRVDGRRTEMDYGEVRATVNNESVTKLVVFGKDDGPVVLGIYTLEVLALAVDPVERRLAPSPPIMYEDHRRRATNGWAITRSGLFALLTSCSSRSTGVNRAPHIRVLSAPSLPISCRTSCEIVSLDALSRRVKYRSGRTGNVPRGVGEGHFLAKLG